MKSSKKLLWWAGAGCAVCCAIPIGAILLGVLPLAAISATALGRELLLCVLPFALLGVAWFGYRVYRRRRACCTTPNDECSTGACGVRPSTSA